MFFCWECSGKKVGLEAEDPSGAVLPHPARALGSCGRMTLQRQWVSRDLSFLFPGKSGGLPAIFPPRGAGQTKRDERCYEPLADHELQGHPANMRQRPIQGPDSRPVCLLISVTSIIFALGTWSGWRQNGHTANNKSMAQGSPKDFFSLEKSKLTLRAGQDFDSVRSGGGFRAPHDPALSAQPLPIPRRCHHPQETNLARTQGQCDARSPNLRHRAPNRKAGSLSTVHQAAQALLQAPAPVRPCQTPRFSLAQAPMPPCLLPFFPREWKVTLRLPSRICRK